MSQVSLRPFRDEDIALFETWLYTPHVAAWYHEPWDWLNEVKSRQNEFSFLHHLIAELDGKPIGFCQYYEYCESGETWHGDTELDGTYSIDYLIGDAEQLGKGHGREIVRLLVQEIKSCRNAQRIIVQPEPENKASCNTLLSCGFSFDAVNMIYVMEL